MAAGLFGSNILLVLQDQLGTELRSLFLVGLVAYLKFNG